MSEKKTKPVPKKLHHKTREKLLKARNRVIEKRLTILIFVVGAVILILAGSLFYVQIVKQSYYQSKLETLKKTIVMGESAPRGRIYDRYHRLIVDNIPVKTITYKRQNGIGSQTEIELAYSLGEYIDVAYDKLTIQQLKEFWVLQYPDLGKQKITEEEQQLRKERKLTAEAIEDLKLERITEEELAEYNETDKEACYIYYLMNNGYYYSEKIIKKDGLTDEEYAIVSEQLASLPGFETKLDWERYYPYGEAFKSILGTVSTSQTGIPLELKDYYLALGYDRNDRVGISYLEYQYEELLKGAKDTFELLDDGSYQLVEAGSRGNDIILTIDIELQKAVEQILINQITQTKLEPNTEYYNRSFVVMTDPSTGELLAMAGKQIINGTIYDYTPGITTSPVVVGSVVKGASHIVGYNTGALQIGEVRNDACIKIASTPEKCSWKYLGNVDDLQALKYSSNTYQFHTAMKVGQGFYQYNSPLALDLSAYNIYRQTFAEFGLGVKTGIDLPVESLGYKGGDTVTGHLLDFAIGQYDTYTPIQLAQYISTIANGGSRMQPYLLKEVYEPSKEGLVNQIFATEPVVLNTVTTTEEYLNRVKQGFKEVLSVGGTGYYYIDPVHNPAGKTGTSQSFVDTDNNGVIDTETITTTFVAYVPADNPIMALAVISPDVSHYGNASSYQSLVNQRITQEVSKKFFEIYQ